MAFTEPIELFCAPSGLITDILQRRLLFPSFLPSLNVTCGEREGGTGAGGLITHYYYCDILWWSAAATCHPF